MAPRQTMAEALARLRATPSGVGAQALHKAHKAHAPSTQDADALPAFEPPVLEHIRQTQLAQYRLTLAAIADDIVQVLHRA